MIRRPPRSTRTDTLFPYTTLFRSIRRAQARLTVINDVDLEEYVYGVVRSEMDPRWPAEALRAQAVAARTLATYSTGRFASERSEEHTSELQSLMRISYAVFCLKKKK